MNTFFATLARGYKILFNEAKLRLPDCAPKVLTASGTGLMLIGSALIARESCKSEVQEVLREAQEALETAKKPQIGDTKITKTKRVLKAKAAKGLKMVKIYKKAVIVDAAGAVLTGGGIYLSEDGRHRAIKAVAALGAEYAGYRAAVRADLGEVADLKYLTGQKAVNTPKPKKNKGKETPVPDEDGVTIVRDPSAFRVLYSKENTPDIWSPNYDMRLANLEFIEAMLSRAYMETWETGGFLTLNDMRRELGGAKPRKWDVECGTVFGRRYIKDKPETHKLFDLHFREDDDFMSGRKDWCWLVFDCDPQPLAETAPKKRFRRVEA